MDSDTQYLGTTPLYSRAKYARELHPELPAEVFEPARSRLLIVPVHLAIIITTMAAIARHWLPGWSWPLASIVIGASMSCLTFVAHEALHGGIARGRVIPRIVGWIGFAPFVVSPRLWMAWHNRVHHGAANAGHDPDAYPTLDAYHHSAVARFAADHFSLGNGRWRGVLSLILGFTGQSLGQLRNASTFLTRREHALALVETGLGVALWATVAVVVGFVPFLFVYLLPLLVANVCVMSFILTNHSLSPRIETNDPLISGLSVTTPRFIEWVTLGFGFHVEHHVFPAMSSRHARTVRTLLQTHWPERYQSMSLVAALGKLHRTARVYADATTLIDPPTGKTFETLMPGEA